MTFLTDLNQDRRNECISNCGILQVYLFTIFMSDTEQLRTSIGFIRLLKLSFKAARKEIVVVSFFS